MPYITKTTHEYFPAEVYLEHLGIKVYHTYNRYGSLRPGIFSFWEDGKSYLPNSTFYMPTLFENFSFELSAYRCWHLYTPGKEYNHKDQDRIYDTKPFDNGKYVYHSNPGFVFQSKTGRGGSYHLTSMVHLAKSLGTYPENWRKTWKTRAKDFQDEAIRQLINNCLNSNWREYKHLKYITGIQDQLENVQDSTNHQP